MKTLKRSCDSCTRDNVGQTEQKEVGLVPLYLFEDSHQPYWVRASVCTRCGALQQLPVLEEQVERAESRYLKVLVESDLLSEEEAKEMLGI